MTQPNEQFAAAGNGPVAEGEVYRRRYSRYAGEREGLQRSYLALIAHSIKRALGIRRRWTAKIIPIILYAAAFIPVIGFIAIPAILGPDIIQLNSVDLFSAISMILLIFAAAASPEMLCDDRREDVLPLYYSRGLSRRDYLLAKLLALGSLMLSVSLLPALILFLGNTFLEEAPFSHFASNFDEVLRIIGCSLAYSLFFASIGLAVSALTERKGVASAIYVGIFLAGSAITTALYEAIDQSWSDFFALVTPIIIPEGITLLFFGEVAVQDSMAVEVGFASGWYLVTVVGFALVSGAILYRRYLRED